MNWRVGLILCVTSLTLVPLGASQDPDSVRLLDEYRGQNADLAVREMARWPEARLIKARTLPAPRSDPWSLAAFALLHLEAGAVAGDFRFDAGLAFSRSTL